MKFLSILCLLVVILGVAENANILAVFPLPSKSHFIFFERIMKELARRGHDVDVVSHFPLKNEKIDGYHDLSLVGSLPNLINNISLDQVHFDNRHDLLKFMFIPCGTETCKSTFNTTVVQNLKTTKKKYDLLITELFTTDCMLGFAHLFKLPIVGMTSSVSFPWASERFGNPDNPAYIPTYFEDYTPEMDLWTRLQNAVSSTYLKWIYRSMSGWESNRLAKEFFGDDLPNLEDIAENTSLLLVNSHFSINQPRPTVPNFVEIGGVHIEEPKPLSKYFQDLINDPKGIIYLSMGSMVKTETFPKTTIQAMFDAFGELDYKVIWKADRNQFPNGLKYPNNIHFEKWLPQLDILCSGKVKLFVSHGGLLGSQEAAFCGTPRVGIPIFADQDLNIRQAINMGLATKIVFEDITKETVLEAAKTVLTNPSYQKNADKLKIRFKDRPMKPLETAIYWIDYVINHKGALHLQSAATRLAWYQYLLLDVIAILITALIVALIILNYLIKKIAQLIFGGSSKTKYD